MEKKRCAACRKLYNSLIVATRNLADGGSDPLIAAAKFDLGFLGGYRLGPGYYWLIIPYAVLMLYLLVAGLLSLRQMNHRSHRIEAEIALTIQIEQHGLIRYFLH